VLIISGAVRGRGRLKRGAGGIKGDGEGKGQIEVRGRGIKGGGEGKGAEAKRPGAALPFWAFA